MRTRCIRFAVSVAALAGLTCGASLCAQDGKGTDATRPPSSFSADARETQSVHDLVQEFHATEQSLSALAQQLHSAGFVDFAQRVRHWHVDPPDDRQLLFLPGDLAEFEQLNVGDLSQQEFYSIRRRRAELVYQRARHLANHQELSAAYRLLYAVLREDPTHPEVRRILGTSGVLNKPTGKRGTSPEPRLGWRAGTYWRIRSPHFMVLANTDLNDVQQLTELCEAYYRIWQQLFLDHWAKAASVQAAFAGRTASPRVPRPFRVVLFADRQQFLGHLKPLEPQIELALGVYRDKDLTTYLYAGEPTLYTTWLHELTHQLFQETVSAPPDVAAEANFWMIEGIAMYCESMRLRDDYAVVGGWDAPRMQTARYRRRVEQAHTRIEELTSLGKRDLQSHPEIRRLYTQAAGLAHFLMDGAQGRYRDGFVHMIRDTYRERSHPQTRSLANTVGTSWQELEIEYDQFLDVTDGQLERLKNLDEVQQLSLGNTSVTGDGLRRLQDATTLEWLDLFGLPISDAALEFVHGCAALKRLNLAGTQVSDQGLDWLAALTGIDELDLSGTRITDAGLAKIAANHPGLKSLWLSGTRITVNGLHTLVGMGKLDTLDVSETGVSSEEWRQFADRFPRRLSGGN